MISKKLGLAAMVATCCLATVTSADAKAKKGKPKAVAAAPAAPVAKAAPASAPVASSGGLAIDCSKVTKEARCGRPSWAAAGSIGAGQAIRGTSGFPSIGEGFVDGNRLVAAVEMGGQFDDQGVIMGFDLTTGDRTVLSGKIEDPAKGPVTVGTGPDLGFVRAVAQGGSSWFAYVSTGTTSPVSIIRIDPKTGNRTLEQKIDGAPKCAGSTAKLQLDNTSGMAAAPDGTVFVAAGNYSKAVAILALKGSSCSVVTMSGAGGFESKGSGPTVESLDHYKSLKYADGKIWALHGMTNSLFTIDVATGNRARVSSGESSTKVGAGEAKLGYGMLAVQGSKVWTTGAWAAGRDFLLTEVGTANGARTEHTTLSKSPASYDATKGVWVHPTKPLLILDVDNALVLYNPATGAANTLSN